MNIESVIVIELPTERHASIGEMLKQSVGGGFLSGRDLEIRPLETDGRRRCDGAKNRRCAAQTPFERGLKSLFGIMVSHGCRSFACLHQAFEAPGNRVGRTVHVTDIFGWLDPTAPGSSSWERPFKVRSKDPGPAHLGVAGPGSSS
jgi:hypothetical protein